MDLNVTNFVDAVIETTLGRRLFQELDRGQTQQQETERRAGFAELSQLNRERAGLSSDIAHLRQLEREEQQAEDHFRAVRRKRTKAQFALSSRSFALDNRSAKVERDIADRAPAAISRLCTRLDKCVADMRERVEFVRYRGMVDATWYEASNYTEITQALTTIAALRREAEALLLSDLDGAALEERLADIWSRRPDAPKVQRPSGAALVAGEESAHVIADLRRRKVVRR